ncbi:MAG: hypothetical protein Unbinned6224contig1001_36 [Prokaryotic dsDNA virus sp.]|nr:MAG: hypothetical protein Unbinned6224contig1001_36 [Prokaryotic dsDNA virus sp.]|tara:strand:- start:18608 stop:19348 length:741 start_codon:yes stop_codon:yes gene_type:complete
MASLLNKTPSETFKDLLTVASETSNQGLENTAKRVFDGEGVGSPLYLGTNTLDVVGTTTITGATTIDGNTSITGTTGITGDTTITGDLAITGNLSYTGTITGEGVSGSAITGTTITGTDIIGGDIISNNYKFGVANATAVDGFIWNNSKTAIEVRQNLITKESMTFSKTGHDDLVISAENGTLEKGDGSKGKVVLGDNDVTLQQGSNELCQFMSDGTIRSQSVGALPSSPSAGDMVNLNGVLYLAV